MAQITSSHGQILSEEQEVVTYQVVSLVTQHGASLLPKTWFWGPHGQSQCLQGGHGGAGARLCRAAEGRSMRGNRHKLKHESFRQISLHEDTHASCP